MPQLLNIQTITSGPSGMQLRAACGSCRPVQRSRSLVATAFLGAADKAAPKAPKAPKIKAAPGAASKPAKAAPPKAAEKKVELKTPRAPSAFNLYMADAYKAAAQAAPDQKSTKIMQTLVGQWKALPADKRQPYEAESEKRKKELAAIRDAIKAEKKKNARPLNAYMAYYVQRLPAIRAAHPGKPLVEAAKIFKAEWQALPAADKEARQAAYQQALEAWKKARPSA